MAKLSTGPYRIAIVGAGPVGVNLAIKLVQAGHNVTISNSRGPGTLRRQEQVTGARAEDLTLAVAESEVVVLAVPVASILSLRESLQACLRQDSILIDAGNYYPGRDGQIEAMDNGTADTAWVSQNFSVPVVKAFNNIIAANITTSSTPKGSPKRAALPVSGGDQNALHKAMKIVEDTGFDAYNAGSLADSWRYQPGQPAYCTEPTLEQLPGLLAAADRNTGPVNRDKTRALVEKLPADYSPAILLRVGRLSVGLDRWSVRSYVSAVAFGFTLCRVTLFG